MDTVEHYTAKTLSQFILSYILLLRVLKLHTYTNTATYNQRDDNDDVCTYNNNKGRCALYNAQVNICSA